MQSILTSLFRMKKLLIYISLALSLATALAPTIAAAQVDDGNRAIAAFEAPIIPRPDTLPGPTVTEQNDSSIRDILVNRILPRVAITFIGFIAGLALVFVIIGGVRFVTAYGNEESIDKAKKQVIYGLVGLMLAVLSYTIVSIVTNLEFTGDTTNREVPTAPPIEDSSVSPEIIPPTSQAA